MAAHLIFYPIIFQITLTILLFILLAVRKSNALKSGLVDESRRALFEDAWPDDVIAVNNCIRNQFEAPVLFYVLSMLLFALNAVSAVTLAIAWLFVVSRFAHAYVHTGSNYVPVRKRLFMVGVLLIAILTVMVSIATGTFV